MTKKELLARIERLESQVAVLSAQVTQPRVPTYPHYYPGTWWCSTSPSTTSGNVTYITGRRDDDPPAAVAVS